MSADLEPADELPAELLVDAYAGIGVPQGPTQPKEQEGVK